MSDWFKGRGSRSCWANLIPYPERLKVGGAQAEVLMGSPPALPETHCSALPSSPWAAPVSFPITCFLTYISRGLVLCFAPKDPWLIPTGKQCLLFSSSCVNMSLIFYTGQKVSGFCQLINKAEQNRGDNVKQNIFENFIQLALNYWLGR